MPLGPEDWVAGGIFDAYLVKNMKFAIKFAGFRESHPKFERTAHPQTENWTDIFRCMICVKA